MHESYRFSANQDQQLESYTVGGVKISILSREQAIDSFFATVSQGLGGLVTVTSAHGVVESQSDHKLRHIINNARMTLADGMPILWVGKLKRVAVQRFPGAEFVESIMQDQRASQIRHYFYGGEKENTSLVVARAREMLGNRAVVGFHCPPFRPLGAFEEESVIRNIAVTHPDVIWVGLSTPKQEYWMANHFDRFPGTTLVGVGAAFDFFAGIQTRASRFVQRTGFEWLFRLAKEPKRLWPRYKRVVPIMLKILFTEVMRLWFISRHRR